MKRSEGWKELAAIAACLWVIPLFANRTFAQDSDSVTINGTFVMSSLWGEVDPELAAIAARGETHTWTMTLHGVSCEYNYLDFSGPDDVYVFYRTKVHAASFDFEWQGPDADKLNEIVRSEWYTKGFLYDVVFKLERQFLNSPEWGFEDYRTWVLQITTLEPGWGGLHFSSLPNIVDTQFPVDDDGYPILEPFVSKNARAEIFDGRAGNNGVVGQYYGNTLAFDAPLPPPPPLPPTLNILDGSVREGHRGTTRLDLTVTLSRNIADTVTVKFATINGTAHAWWDYTATSGTLTFQPGQTSRTISVSIKGERKREPNETFTVQLSNPTGATIADGIATVTILNDD